MPNLVLMTDSNSVRKLWMPLQKKGDNSYFGILSNNSIDRDDERMSPDLLRNWATTRALPTLTNHKNRMENLAGVWKDFEIFNSGDGEQHALGAKLFLLKSNPHTAWVGDVIKEAEELGLPVGVSISAIPTKFKDYDMKDDGFRREWLEAELVEGTIIPVPSNRDAFAVVAKGFDVDKRKRTHSDKWKRCVADVKRRGGVESPEAVCTAALGAGSYKSFEDAETSIFVDNIIKEGERKMTEDTNKPEEQPEEEPEVEEDKSKEIKDLADMVKSLTSELGELKKNRMDRKSVLKAIKETVPTTPESNEPELVEKSEYTLHEMQLASIGRVDLIK